MRLRFAPFPRRCSAQVTCSELLVCGAPALLVPSPHVTADHQRVNGRAMRDTGAAQLLDEKQLTAAALAERVRALLAVCAAPYPNPPGPFTVLAPPSLTGSPTVSPTVLAPPSLTGSPTVSPSPSETPRLSQPPSLYPIEF
jgi:hypothetical protein